ncbi:transglutaminase-like domain-containing protein [Formosa agariphila]|uniref:transglutaminase-like domain-containing protein n=1 Tax=Formosa agariphila TaxID=320324 RepID=UPI00130D764C|nr:transglutaminase-like domain-containing protein [Formosa agariphila]
MAKNSIITEMENYNTLNKKSDLPICFFNINTKIFESGRPVEDLETVKKMSVWLRNHIKGGPGLSLASDDALDYMLTDKGGVCSDFAQIFNNFCVINNIKVREWGTARNQPNGKFGGHSFNEVYISELNKWVLIDVSYCVMFYLHSEIPLSVIEMFELIRVGENIECISFNTDLNVDERSMHNNYFYPDTVPFLICSYRNKVYDKVLKHSKSVLPVFVSHFLIYLTGKSYYYKFPLDDYKKIFS